MEFKDRFKLLVKERGTTQEAIADMLKVHRVTISKWMASGILPRADQIVKIAEALGVSVDYLMTGSRAEHLLLEPKEPVDERIRWIQDHQELIDSLRKLPPESLGPLQTLIQTMLRK